MDSINEEESTVDKNDENLEKTFETTATTLFGSITDGNSEDNINHENEDTKNSNDISENKNEQEINESHENNNIIANEDSHENDNIIVNEDSHENNNIILNEGSHENDNILVNDKNNDNKMDINLENNDERLENDKNNDNETLQKDDSNQLTESNTAKVQMPKSESSDFSKKNKDEINSLAQQILDGTKEPTSVEFDDTLPVLTYITRYRNEKMASHEVNEAERSDNIIATIIHNYRDTLKTINRQKKEEFIKNKLQKAEKKLEQAEKETKRSISELKAQNDQSLQELKAVQNQEVDNLINKFNSPVIQRHYTQASSHLRTLRFQMQLLQHSKRFDELRIAQQYVANEEKREIENVSRSMASQLKSQIKLLEEKHRCEIESRQIAFEDREAKMRRNCTMKTDAIKNHINNVTADLQMLQTKQTESSQNIMQNGELMLKITKATATKKSRPQTSVQKKSNKKAVPFFQRENEAKNMSKSYGEADLFSLKLPPLIQSKGTKAKREKLLEEYKA